MVTVADLQVRVGAGFALLGLPSWPDPHPDMASPREEEYSRVTDPERYRVVHARARLWTAALRDELGARGEALDPQPGDGGTLAFDRGVRIVPRRPGSLPLLLLERDVPSDGATLAVLEVAVARPDVVVERLPDCGCDACDSGSASLLEAVDAAITQVVGGPFVVLRTRRWRAVWHPEGGSLSSTGRSPDLDRVMGVCRRLADGERVRLPRGAEAVVGQSWVG